MKHGCESVVVNDRGYSCGAHQVTFAKLSCSVLRIWGRKIRVVLTVNREEKESGKTELRGDKIAKGLWEIRKCREATVLTLWRRNYFFLNFSTPCI